MAITTSSSINVKPLDRIDPSQLYHVQAGTKARPTHPLPILPFSPAPVQQFPLDGYRFPRPGHQIDLTIRAGTETGPYHKVWAIAHR
jgi:hypothetical protein